MRRISAIDFTNVSKTYLFLVFLTFVTPLRAQRVDVSNEREIDVANPPAHLKQSALIEFLQRRKHTHFPKTVESAIDQMIYAGVSPIRSYAPFGRSLQRPNTDATAPRILVMSTTANKVATRYPVGGEDHTAFPGTDYEGRLFAGFSKRAGQGEVISWNRGTYQNDFFVVTDMGKRTAPVVREVTNRQICLRCHQNGSALFGIAPWSEILAHDPSDPNAQQPAPPFTHDPVVFLKDGVVIHREATPSPIGNNNGLAGETAVVAAIRLMQAANAVKNLCGQNLECRRYVLIAAVFNASQSTFIRKNHYLTGPAAGATPDDFQDIDFLRTPMAVLKMFTNPNPPGPLIVQVNLPPFLHGLSYLDGFKEIAEPLWPDHNWALISHLLPDPLMVVSGKVTAQESEPTTNRPSAAFTRIPSDVIVPYFYDVAFEAMGFNYQDSLKFQAIPLADRMAKLQLENGSIPPRLRPLLQQWPPSREQVLAYYGIRDESALEIPNQASPQADQGVDETARGELFKNYCLRCHDGEGAGPKIPFGDLNSLREWNTNHGSKIVTRLTTSNQRIVMPPAEEEAKHQPSERERTQMLSLLAAAAKVDQMRGVVYTNYLGVRVQNVTKQDASFIVPNRSLVISQTGFSDECGETFIQSDESARTDLKVGVGSDGRIYLALENFANYLPGNIVQTILHRTENGKCAPFGVSRVGRLLRVGYNKRRDLIGVVSLIKNGDKSLPGIAHVAASSSDGQFLAVGKDGNLYRVNFEKNAFNSYNLSRINVTGTIDGRWAKVAFKKAGTETVAIAETVDGVRFNFLPLAKDQHTLTVNAKGPALTVMDFSPNLLDRDSLLLNPN